MNGFVVPTTCPGIVLQGALRLSPQEVGITHPQPVSDSGLPPHRKIYQGQNDAGH